MSQRQNFVNNRYVKSHSSVNFDLIDPTTGESIGKSPISNKQDVEEAYAAAEAATATWGRTTPS
ncbi:aldehyde dehydrogenase family protein, partial [Psychrobacter maritimus]